MHVIHLTRRPPTTTQTTTTRKGSNYGQCKNLTSGDHNQMLRANETGETSLHIAAYLGQTKIVKSLISEGANVNGRSSRLCRTPLHNAVIGGNIAVVKALIANGTVIFINFL